MPGSLDAEEVIDSARTNDFELEEKKDETDAPVVRQEISPVYLEDDGSEVYKLPPETAEDFVTEVIHARDDPALNPWTFRTALLGKCDLGPPTWRMLTTSRNWSSRIWSCAGNHLLLQAPDRGSVDCLLGSYQLCTRRSNVKLHSKEKLAWAFLKSSSGG